jgi:hypothetical protein
VITQLARASLATSQISSAYFANQTTICTHVCIVIEFKENFFEDFGNIEWLSTLLFNVFQYKCRG